MTDDFMAKQQFLIVDSLIYPAILGTDFLYKHHLCLDFTTSLVTVQHNTSDLDSVQPLWDATIEATAAIGTTSDHDIVEKCSIPCYDKPITYDVPPCNDITIGEVFRENTSTCLDQSTLAYHHIATTENPVQVPPRRIPSHYKQEVEQQICDMLQQGTIEESCSPWMAPAVFC